MQKITIEQSRWVEKTGINLPIKVWRKALNAISKTGFRFLLLKWLNQCSPRELVELKNGIISSDCVPFSLHCSAYLFLDDPVFYEVSLSRTKEEVLRAKAIGSQDLTIHPPMLLDPELPKSVRSKLFRDFLIELNDFVHKEKIELTISLENSYSDEATFRKPDELIEIIRQTNKKHIGLCLDTGHINVLGTSPVNALKDIPYGMVQATHLHDNYGLKDEHNIPGDGNIDWGGVFQGLTDVGYTKPLIFEVLSEKPMTVEDDITKTWNAFSKIKDIKPLQKKNTLVQNASKTPDVLDQYYNEAELLFSQGHYDQATAVYKKIIDDSAFSNKAHWATLKIAYIHQKTGKFEDARNVWKSFAETNHLGIFDGMASEILKRL